MSCLYVSHVGPCPSVELHQEASRARTFTQIWLGHVQWQWEEAGQPLFSFVVSVHPLHPVLRASVCTHKKAEPRLSSTLLLIPPALQPAKGTCVSCVKPQDWGTQYVDWNAHSPWRISPHVISLFLRVPCQGHRLNLITSLPAQLHVAFSYIPGCTGVFLPVSI